MNSYLSVSPYQLYLYYNDLLKKKTASYQAFGQVVHSLLLEGNENFHFYTKDRRTKEGKEAYKVLKEQHNILLSQSDYDAIYRMRDSFNQFVSINNDAQVETKLNWVDVDSGVPCVAKLDMIQDDGIYELKSTLNIEGFREDIIKYRYFAQAAFYVDAVKTLTGKSLDFRWLIIEKKRPYKFLQLKADRKLLGQGRQWYKKMCAIYAHCLKTDYWSEVKP
jgi:hypothetical protein